KLNEPARTPPKAEEDVARRNLVSPFARGAALAGRVRLSRARHASQVDGIEISRCLSAGASDRSCPRFEARRIASITIAVARTLRRTGRAGHVEGQPNPGRPMRLAGISGNAQRHGRLAARPAHGLPLAQ